MDLRFLDKKGVRQLRNVLMYLDDNDSITHPSQKTMLSKKHNRKEIIASSFKNLTKKDKELLIAYIKKQNNVIDEFIGAFVDFKNLEEKDDIADFLHILMTDVPDEKIKLKIFELIHTNHIPLSLTIITEAEPQTFKEELCKSCVSSNFELGYIYGLLSDTEIIISEELEPEKLVYEINYIQSFSNHPVLDMVMEDYDDVDAIVSAINNRIENRDFRMLYTLAKNSALLDSYNINIGREDLMLLKWAIDITESVDDDIFIAEIGKKDLSLYSNEWLYFISMNLLQMGLRERRLAIMILNYLIDREEFAEEYANKIADGVSKYIRNNEEIKYEALEILNRLNTIKGFYNVLDSIYREGLVPIKDDKFTTYISKKVIHTREFQWISQIESSSKYIEPKAKINPKALIFALREKSPKSNYQILNKIRKNNSSLYSKTMAGVTELIAKDLDEDEKYTKLMIALDYKCKNKNVMNKIKQYEVENSMMIREFIEICDPNRIKERYIKKLNKAIADKDISNIIDILESIEEPELKIKCSTLVFEALIEDEFENLIDICEYLSLDIQSKIKLKEKAFGMLTKKQIDLTEKNIDFVNKLGLDSVTLYNSIENGLKRRYLLDLWYKSNEMGKITAVLKNKLTNEVECLDDISSTYRLSEDYGINDHNLSMLIKIKAYMMISIELIELDMSSEENIHKLDELAGQLKFYDLVDRFLMDELLQRELDTRVVDYIFKKLIDNIDSDDLLLHYWNNIMADLANGRDASYNSKMEIFLGHLIVSNRRVEWFLDIIDDANISRGTYLSMLETLLILSNKQNRIIMQSRQEIDHIQDKILTRIGMGIGEALGSMERTIINRTTNTDDDILIENLKKLRRELKAVGIDTVEDIGNYGKMVKLDGDIHEDLQLGNLDEGVVDSLGVKVNNKLILLSTLLDTE